MENLIINPYPKQVFVFGNDNKLGSEILELMGDTISNFEIKSFDDGERIPHQTETVRGRDVFIIFTSQNGKDTDRWLIDYLRFVYSVKNGHPHRITVIIPKLPHQRADVENMNLREPKMSEWYPTMLKAAGADYIIVCKLHNPASCTINPPMDNVDTVSVIVENIKERFPDLKKIAIAACDLGGSKYARRISKKLGTPLIITDKDRDPVTGKSKSIKVYTYGKISKFIDTVIYVDDLIATFNTMRNGADTLNKRFKWILNYYAVATHPDFGKNTLENILNSRFKELWVTNTVPVKDEFVKNLSLNGRKIEIISIAKLLAKVIDNVHNGKQISHLWD